MSIQDQLRPTLEPALTPLGLLLEDLTVTPAGKRRVLRVVLDHDLDATGDTSEPTISLSLDEVAEATRAVSAALDATDVMGEQPYVLEVTSPGIDRPLTVPRHFRRNVSRLVTITPHEGDALTGRIVRAGERDLTVEVPPTRTAPSERRTVAYTEVSRAVVQVEFSHAEGSVGADELDPDSTTKET